MFKSNALIMAGTVIMVTIIAAFVWVDVSGKSTDPLVEFFKWLLTIVPIVVVGLINTRNNATISQQVSNVETATNGKLTAQLAAQTEALKQHTNEVVNTAVAEAVNNAMTNAAVNTANAATNPRTGSASV